MHCGSWHVGPPRVYARQGRPNLRAIQCVVLAGSSRKEKPRMHDKKRSRTGYDDEKEDENLEDAQGLNKFLLCFQRSTQNAK